MPRLRRKRSDVQFCLDANLSIEAVLNLDNVVHVSQLSRLHTVPVNLGETSLLLI